ncbi:MAG: calcium/sodium antiporter, partial [Dorea sp.]|nr:calcium/sodium antiporter [Dorea sp.]
MDYILLILGFVLLIKGADYFVDGSSSVARILKVPTIIIGLTVVAFGTSMPELSVSVTAALKGENDLAVSNVLGSNIFNLLVVLGCCALVNPVQAKWSLLKKEFPFSIFVAVILLLLNSDFSVTKVLSGSGTFVLGRWGGMLFLILFGMFLYATVREALTSRDGTDEDEGEAGKDREEYKVLTPARSAVYIVCGLAGIVLGGELVVNSATGIAVRFGLSQTFIGLTIVALGTSLPELVTSMVAAGKGENDLAVGNVVG